MSFKKYRKQIVFLMDILIMIGVSMTLFVLSPVGNGTGSRDFEPLFLNLLVWIGCIAVFQLLFHTYDSLWRYAEGKEYFSLLAGFGFGTAAYLLLTEFFFQRQLAGLFMISVSGMAMLLSLLVRFWYRIIRRRKIMRAKYGKILRKVAIIGAGDAGVSLAREIQQQSNYEVVLLLDDDDMRIGMRILDMPVKGPINNLPEILSETEVSEIVFAIPSCGAERKKEILDLCAQTGCHLRMLPDRVAIMEKGSSLLAQMRNVQVEDLLGRNPITLDNEDIGPMIQGHRVLVTGGSGSIGSELCRQIAAHHPQQLVLIDNYENTTYELQLELIRNFGPGLDLVTEIVSVQDKKRINELFQQYKPELVFHAAAHKHVPLMEASPDEAIKNNVFGTLNVVKAADAVGVHKFVLISTDKAVNPTSIMGATKRICEMILASMSNRSNTEFVAVRFGNVLGSNGSVIPLFRKQIEQGGPVTITDRRIIRYFMTIPEAVSLVLQAGAMAKKSEVFVLDMGEPVKIIDLAENLIRLSGYIPYVDIPIVEVGLRPGEKLYEELLVGDKNQEKTAHKLIFVDRNLNISKEEIDRILYDLGEAADSGDHRRVFDSLHRCIPEFRQADEVNASFLTETEEQGDCEAVAAC